jgi:hypothetical protein
VWRTAGARASSPGCPLLAQVVAVRFVIELRDLGLALALFMARVRLADHHDVSIATDDAAVVTDGLDAGVYLHETFLALAVFELAGCHESLLSSAIALSGTTFSNGPVV